MKITRILAATFAVLLPLAVSATTLVIPASGTGPGANDSHWQTELTLHNLSASPVAATLTFHDALGSAGTSSISVAPRATVAIADVVASRFGRQAATGAIEVTFDSAFAQKLTVSSRTFNKSATGEFGQDIPAVDQSTLADAGSTIVLSGPSSTTDARFNFGVYADSAATIQWDLIRADGTIAASKEISYAAGTQTQYNTGLSTLFNAASQDNDTVHAIVTSGRAVAYGSVINNKSGDPSYVPGLIALPDTRLNFLGVAFGDSTSVNVPDANHDGVLDRSLDVQSGSWPIAFRIVVNSTTPATFELLNAPAQLRFYDANGGLTFWPDASSSGKTLNVKVRVTADGVTEIITIPFTIH
ncbi:MAG: hypothetical protein JO093_02910 [Acidobacteria bacterium]|nr:hypothetical protein [Acidobacteriota bacterium]MBV9071010.1 hypothetical protein [Acidobacteriota bacterium]MBV9184537.1 hypothetical protein [Acidobacteriota bacterium]